MSNPQISIIDYTVNLEQGFVFISAMWGNTDFTVNVPQVPLLEEWFTDTGRNEGQDDEGETWEVPFEPYMETQFYQDEALDLVKYVIKNHWKLIHKS
jgi:hypothetical protein